MVALAAMALCCEGGMRLFRSHLSRDAADNLNIPAVAAAESSAPAPRMLFVGDSTTRDGIDTDVIRASLLAGSGVSAKCYRVNPDASSIPDWYYLFKKYFAGRAAPDYLVIGFRRAQLSDSEAVHGDRIAAYYGGFSIAPELFAHDIPSLGDRIDYLLSSALVTFSEKNRVRTRVLATVVPGYRAEAQRLEGALDSGETGPPGSSPAGYSRLDRMLRLCAERRLRVIVVAMPVTSSYPIDDGLRDKLREYSALLIDLRTVPGITPDSFADPIHMRPETAAIFSRVLAGTLRDLILNPIPTSRDGTLH